MAEVGPVQTVTWESAERDYASTRARMIALQEELDWDVYQRYGLLTDDEAAELIAAPEDVPELKLGERAFEIVLARKVAAGEAETQWFSRHNSTPVTEIPAHWSEGYKRVVAKRIETIESRRDLALIERPECKRRWSAEPWAEKYNRALRTWLLDKCEDRWLWFGQNEMGQDVPEPQTVNRLADRLLRDEEVLAVARLYARRDADLADVLAEIIDGEHVPHLSALRYKSSGLRKRAQWEVMWDLQRKEDETGERLDIAIPDKYSSTDFLKPGYWSNRGKLDVPKERFVSYPGGARDGDGSLLLGWAGWDHREQAAALHGLISTRAEKDGWKRDQLLPLLAGLAEVLPWVKQWHGEVVADFGMSWADAYESFLGDLCAQYGLAVEDLSSWRPAKPGWGLPAKRKK